MLINRHFFNNMNIMHKSFLYGLCVAIAVVFYLLYAGIIEPLLFSRDVSKWVFGFILSAIALLWISIWFFKWSYKNIAAKNIAIDEKLWEYRRAIFFRWCILTLAGLLFLTAYFISGLKEILLLLILMVGLLFASNTNAVKVAKHLNVKIDDLPFR